VVSKVLDDRYKTIIREGQKGYLLMSFDIRGRLIMEVKLSLWGGRTVHQQEAWVEKFFVLVKNSIASHCDANVSTCGSLCATTLKNSYARGRVFPFINIPIRYLEKELLGLYEYCDELPLSDQYIYCDFVVHSIYYADNKEPAIIKTMEEQAMRIFQTKGYDIVQFLDGMATITIERELLENEVEFIELFHTLLDDALNIQAALV